MDVYDLHSMQKEESHGSPLSVVSVALGNFDGVHLGHTELIKRTVAHAKAAGHASAVWTFSDGDSLTALPNKPGARCITTAREKLELISELGVDYAFLEDFESVRNYSPEKFVKELLVEKCKAVCAVCGFNFRFGKMGVGNSEDLRRLMSPYECIVVPPYTVNGKTVSSSLIRLLIESGDMEGAAELLGRRFFIDFPVVSGKALGRTIGIPTINQSFPIGHIIPRCGIYACTVEIGKDIFLGVANIGTRPTIKNDNHQINCETHIINYNGWLYDKNIKVSFYKRLRDEMCFDGISALKMQVERDIARTLRYFEDK